MGRRTRIGLWSVSVISLLAPQLMILWHRLQAHGGPPLSETAVGWWPIPVRLLVQWGVAAAIVLAGSLLVLRTPAAKRTRFLAPSRRDADVSLVAFAVPAAVLGLLTLDAWFGGGLTVAWRTEGWTATILLSSLWAIRRLGRRRVEEVWGMGLGARPGRELLVGLYGAALILLLSALPAWATAHSVNAGDVRRLLVLDSIRGVVVTPVVEETLFRGALYAALRGSCRASSSAVIAAALFAAGHGLDPRGWPTAAHFMFGIVACLLREWRGTLVPCIAAHALNNATLAIPRLIRWFGYLAPLP